MRKHFITFVLIIIALIAQGQIGYLGKRHVVTTNLFSTIYQGKYNLSYNFCLSKSFMPGFSFSSYSKTYNIKNNYLYPDVYWENATNDNFDVFYKNIQNKAYSWELGFLTGYYIINGMPVPLGYMYGISLEHISGKITEKCDVFKETDVKSTSKNFIYPYQANIYKFSFHRNTYLYKNIILSASIQLGFSISSVKISGLSDPDKPPYKSLPKTNLVSELVNELSEEDVFENDFERSMNGKKYKYRSLYIMPSIGLGYIF